MVFNGNLFQRETKFGRITVIVIHNHENGCLDALQTFRKTSQIGGQIIKQFSCLYLLHRIFPSETANSMKILNIIRSKGTPSFSFPISTSIKAALDESSIMN